MASSAGAGRGPATLSLLDCVGIGINGIIGSGIFLLPGRLAREAGPASILAFLLCGGLCFLIALCFAEMAGMYERSGGAYLYAKEAFGEAVGFGVGWMSLATGVLALSAVARGAFDQVGALWPALRGGVVLPLGAALFIAALSALNYFGLKLGARTSDFFSAAKLVPLLLFAAVGIFSMRASAFTPFGPPSMRGLASAMLIAVFACSGFEFVPVPAGEATRARRNVPIALLGSVLGATGLYALVQSVVVGCHPSLAGSKRPIVEAAAAVLGPWGGSLVGAGAVISMAGFCAGCALVGPRYLSAFASDGLLPTALARLHPRYGTPALAIAANGAVAALLAATLDFEKLVDISNVALFAQYVPTCLAVPVLRRKRPDAPRSYRLPFGSLIPLMASLVSVGLLFAAAPGRAEWLASGATLALGYAVYGLRKKLAGLPRLEPKG